MRPAKCKFTVIVFMLEHFFVQLLSFLMQTCLAQTNAIKQVRPGCECSKIPNLVSSIRTQRPGTLCLCLRTRVRILQRRLDKKSHKIKSIWCQKVQNGLTETFCIRSFFAVGRGGGKPDCRHWRGGGGGRGGGDWSENFSLHIFFIFCFFSQV